MNREIAARLDEAAWLLRDQGADPYRVNAYLRAAASVRRWPESLNHIFHERGLDGLEDLPGVEPTIARAIRELILHGVRPLPDRRQPQIPVDELLDVDREYREAAASGSLQVIAPRRFNPTAEAWLPILHTRRGTRRYTVLYSNTAHAHRAGKTRDWVVLYADGPAGKRQYTVLTATRGPLCGRRIIAGRERECQSEGTAAAA